MWPLTRTAFMRMTEIIGGDEFILDSDGGGTVNGFYYDAGSMEYIRKQAEKQEANKAATEKLVEQMHKDGEKARENANNQEYIQDFLNRLHSGE